jgi:WD domain, G-beta repeat
MLLALTPSAPPPQYVVTLPSPTQRTLTCIYLFASLSAAAACPACPACPTSWATSVSSDAASAPAPPGSPAPPALPAPPMFPAFIAPPATAPTAFRIVHAPPDFRLKEMERWLRDQVSHHKGTKEVHRQPSAETANTQSQSSQRAYTQTQPTSRVPQTPRVSTSATPVQRISSTRLPAGVRRQGLGSSRSSNYGSWASTESPHQQPTAYTQNLPPRSPPLRSGRRHPNLPPPSQICTLTCPKLLRTLCLAHGQLSHWPAMEMTIHGHEEPINSVAFSPNGQRIALGSCDDSIRVWDATTGELVVSPFVGHTNWVSCVAFSPGGQHIASASADGTIWVWDTATGEIFAGPFTNDTSMVYSVAYSPDGERIASALANGTICVWDVANGTVIALKKPCLPVPQQGVRTLSLQFRSCIFTAH